MTIEAPGTTCRCGHTYGTHTGGGRGRRCLPGVAFCQAHCESFVPKPMPAVEAEKIGRSTRCSCVKGFTFCPIPGGCVGGYDGITPGPAYGDERSSTERVPGEPCPVPGCGCVEYEHTGTSFSINVGTGELTDTTPAPVEVQTYDGADDVRETLMYHRVLGPSGWGKWAVGSCPSADELGGAEVISTRVEYRAGGEWVPVEEIAVLADEAHRLVDDAYASWRRRPIIKASTGLRRDHLVTPTPPLIASGGWCAPSRTVYDLVGDLGLDFDSGYMARLADAIENADPLDRTFTPLGRVERPTEPPFWRQCITAVVHPFRKAFKI